MQEIAQKDLEALRAQAVILEERMQLRHAPMQLWPHLMQKDLLSRKAGMGKAEYDFHADPKGGSEVFVKTTLMGMLPVMYQELPHEWRPPAWHEVERIFKEGSPLRYLRGIWELRETDTGGTDLSVQFRYVAGFPMMKPVVQRMLQRMLRRIRQVHQETDRRLQDAAPQGFETYFERPAGVEDKIHQLQATWQALMPDSQIPAKLAEYIHTVPDKYADRLRPFEMADYYGLPRMEVLHFCLLATRNGYLDLSWDILCPSCRGAKAHIPHLDKIHASAHCEACNIRFDAGFDQNVEVTFRPAPSVRKLEAGTYCMLNPGGLPHIWAQVNVAPGQSRATELYLPAGQYKLHTPTLADSVLLYSDAGADGDEVNLSLDDGFAGQAELRRPERVRLQVHNPHDYRQTLKVERLHYRERAASAALVTTLQDFRDLFGSEVLRPGVQLGVSNLVFLFTDLKDSTRMYEDKGDAGAFALVQEHFDMLLEIIRRHDGGVVKTIGDAVMAVFTDSAGAVRAALQILDNFDAYNREQPTDKHLVVKLGMHKGPCIALNLNDKLDYFGSTINRAARTQGQSIGGDLVLSKDLYQESAVQTLLAEQNVDVEAFSAELKGIESHQNLYRLILPHGTA